jgi:hypothetical protein
VALVIRNFEKATLALSLFQRQSTKNSTRPKISPRSFYFSYNRTRTPPSKLTHPSISDPNITEHHRETIEQQFFN